MAQSARKRLEEYRKKHPNAFGVALNKRQIMWSEEYAKKHDAHRKRKLERGASPVRKKRKP